jgi:excisionase family DNA binding protein
MLNDSKKNTGGSMEKLYTIREAAAILGISKRSLERLTKEGKLPVVWVLKTKRMISERDLQAYIETQRGNKGEA